MTEPAKLPDGWKWEGRTPHGVCAAGPGVFVHASRHGLCINDQWGESVDAPFEIIYAVLSEWSKQESPSK